MAVKRIRLFLDSINRYIRLYLYEIDEKSTIGNDQARVTAINETIAELYFKQLEIFEVFL